MCILCCVVYTESTWPIAVYDAEEWMAVGGMSVNLSLIEQTLGRSSHNYWLRVGVMFDDDLVILPSPGVGLGEGEEYEREVESDRCEYQGDDGKMSEVKDVVHPEVNTELALLEKKKESMLSFDGIPEPQIALEVDVAMEEQQRRNYANQGEDSIRNKNRNNSNNFI